MKILVTGSNGFIGKNLCIWLERAGYSVLKVDLDNLSDLDKYVPEADFIIHLAGINRPLDPKEFLDGNVNSIVKVTKLLKKHKKKTPILMSSSTQAANENDYGRSKKQAEDYLFSFAKTNKSPVYVYRFQNVFGKWCRPNYNSVIATWCYNISHCLDIRVDDESKRITFVYIDDICQAILNILSSDSYLGSEGIMYVWPSYDITLGHIAYLLRTYKESRNNKFVPYQRDEFERKLYATYLSYLEEDDFSYELKMNVDNRGSFTEFLKTEREGQVSINVSKPGITKGNHYHHSKNEKFLVVSGTCSIKFRKIGTDKVIEYICSGDKLQVVDIPTGYTHNITNIGDTDSVTVMWASELFDSNRPDTYFEEVEINGK